MIYSHGGFYRIVDHPRCISDEAAKAIAAKGGVIGIHFGSLFNNPKYWAWQKPNIPVTSQPVPLNLRGTIPDECWMHVDQLAKVIDYGVRLACH